jgi:hypothetical protein
MSCAVVLGAGTAAVGMVLGQLYLSLVFLGSLGFFLIFFVLMPVLVWRQKRRGDD